MPAPRTSGAVFGPSGHLVFFCNRINTENKFLANISFNDSFDFDSSLSFFNFTKEENEASVKTYFDHQQKVTKIVSEIAPPEQAELSKNAASFGIFRPKKISKQLQSTLKELYVCDFQLIECDVQASLAEKLAGSLRLETTIFNFQKFSKNFFEKDAFQEPAKSLLRLLQFVINGKERRHVQTF